MKPGTGHGCVLLLVAALTFHAAGCDKEGPVDAAATPQPAQGVKQPAGHDEHNWWCAEHGVPEEVCGQCNARYAAECKKKGDWCREHDRPESQCFLHHPALKEKYAALYRAKYGKDPPPTEDEIPEAGARP